MQFRNVCSRLRRTAQEVERNASLIENAWCRRRQGRCVVGCGQRIRRLTQKEVQAGDGFECGSGIFTAFQGRPAFPQRFRDSSL